MLYLDNAATSKMKKEVIDEMLRHLDCYGNTEAKFYEISENAKKIINIARERVADLINAKPSEIVFTSGATEANNTVLKGIFFSSKKHKKRIIISAIEHSSIYDTCLFLQDTFDLDLCILPVDKEGRINLDDLKQAINTDTILVSIIWVNNEVGTIQNIEGINKICLENDVPLHCDATQAAGKVLIDFNKYQALQFLTFTAHKIYGPKGIGALVIKEDNNGIKHEIYPLLHGGEQEDGLRAGTLSNLLIVGFGKACEIAQRDFEINRKNILRIETKLIEKLKLKFKDKLVINNDFSNKVHDILNIRLIGFNNMILLKSISPIIAASTGSACSIAKPSRILKNMGFSDKEINESIRLSFSSNLNLNDLSVIDDL